jgi:general secretion pathway protein E
MGIFSMFRLKAVETAPSQPARRVLVAPAGAARIGQVPVSQSANDAQASPPSPTEGSSAPATGRAIGGVLFSSEAEIETTQQLGALQFFQILNEELKLAPHYWSKVAVAQVLANTKECILMLDRSKVHANDIEAVVDVLRKQGFKLRQNGPQGYWLSSQLVIALAQGHIDRDGMRAERDIAKDPHKSALLNAFMDIVAWAYANNADDIDFAVDIYSPQSQVAFKIAGKYVRPSFYSLATDTVVQMLGTAWQISTGGESATFQVRMEQQAKVELTLQPSARIPSGARVRLRWSGMANDKGTVVTMRLQRLGESAKIRSLESAGYPSSQMAVLRRVIRSEGGLIIFAGVVGSGKSTSLAQLLVELPTDIKKISIEDPVELEIPLMYQKTVTRDLTATGDDPAFLSAVRAIFRSALDVLLLGEIRDQTTGLLARQIAESGHTVYTTIHAKGALGVFDRMASPAIGVPREVLATPGIVKVVVYQALLPVSCPHCRKDPDAWAQAMGLTGENLVEHKHYFARIERMYKLQPSLFRLRDPRGCKHCRKEDLPELNGFAGRTVVSEMIEPDEQMLEFILKGQNVQLHRYWRSTSDGIYDSDDLTGKTAMECAIYKVARGEIDPREIERRFDSFETLEAKQLRATRSRSEGVVQ